MKGVIWLGSLVSTYCVIVGLCGAVAVQNEQVDVQCGIENMQVVISRHIKDGSKLKILHKHGKMNALRTDVSCSLWVAQKPDGSVIIGTAYEGCYVKQTETDFVLTLGFSTRQDGGKNVMVRKELKCSVQTYQDAPSQDQCAAVPRPDRMSGFLSQDSEDSCISAGGCYDPSDRTTPCYYATTVTARCTPEGFFSIAVPSTLTAPRLDLNTIRLLGNGTQCDPVARNDMFLLYEFPLSSCGTTFKVIGDQAVYENELQATKTIQTWNRISITRHTTFRLLIRCSFAVTGFLPLKVDVVTFPPPPPVSSEGPLLFEMRLSVDSQYNNYEDLDSPPVKVLGDPVYAEVRILQKNDPQLVLVLHQCWATPTHDPLDEMQWPILVNGCPFTGDNYISEQIPVDRSSTVMFPSHYSRFRLKTFAFVDENTGQALEGQVYTHCSASACIASLEKTCMTMCYRTKRSHVLLENSGTVLVSSDIPVYFETSLQNAQKELEVHGVRRLSQAHDQINLSLVILGILGVLLLTLCTWAFNRQRKSRSLLISKPPSLEKSVHIRTVSGKVAMS